MPEFILLCRDQENSFALRAATRSAHLDYIRGHRENLLLAGPMLDDEGRSIGSILIIEVENIDAARTFASGDPYAIAGLFEDTQIRPFKIVTGALADQKG